MSTIRQMKRINILRVYIQASTCCKRLEGNITNKFKCFSDNTSNLKFFSSSSRQNSAQEDHENDNDFHRPLMLMSFQTVVWPKPIQLLKNRYFAFLIRYFDPNFDISMFKEGAIQAVIHVSECIYRGDFAALNGLVDSEIIPEIKRNYQLLTKEQREFIPVKPDDVSMHFVYQIGMIFEDKSDHKFVEIMFVLHGVPGADIVYGGKVERPFKNTYICNYRFIKEITKGVEDDWKINKLNHRLARELKIQW